MLVLRDIHDGMAFLSENHAIKVLNTNGYYSSVDINGVYISVNFLYRYYRDHMQNCANNADSIDSVIEHFWNGVNIVGIDEEQSALLSKKIRKVFDAYVSINNGKLLNVTAIKGG